MRRYAVLAIDEPHAEVTILAVFFGGADHPRRIAERLARAAQPHTPH